MFKRGSHENELYQSMGKSLAQHQVERKTYELHKLAKAVDYLHHAATIFEQADMLLEADLITEVLFKLAKDLQ